MSLLFLPELDSLENASESASGFSYLKAGGVKER